MADAIETRTIAGQVAIVTGGGTSPGRVASIGEATARLLAARGVRVAVVDIDREAAERTVATIQGEDGQAVAIAADLRHETGCAAAVEAALAALERLDERGH